MMQKPKVLWNLFLSVWNTWRHSYYSRRNKCSCKLDTRCPTKHDTWCTHRWLFSKSKFNLKSDRVNLVTPASPIECLLLFPGRYSTNWDRKGWPGSEIQMYYGCPWGNSFECLLPYYTVLDVLDFLLKFFTQRYFTMKSIFPLHDCHEFFYCFLSYWTSYGRRHFKLFKKLSCFAGHPVYQKTLIETNPFTEV